MAIGLGFVSIRNLLPINMPIRIRNWSFEDVLGIRKNVKMMIRLRNNKFRDFSYWESKFRDLINEKNQPVKMARIPSDKDIRIIFSGMFAKDNTDWTRFAGFAWTYTEYCWMRWIHNSNQLGKNKMLSDEIVTRETPNEIITVRYFLYRLISRAKRSTRMVNCGLPIVQKSKKPRKICLARVGWLKMTWSKKYKRIKQIRLLKFPRIIP